MANTKETAMEEAEVKEVKKPTKQTTKVKTATKASAKKETVKKEVKKETVKKEPKAKTSKIKEPKVKVAEVKSEEVKAVKKTTKVKTIKKQADKKLINDNKKKAKGSVIFIRPQAIKMERDKNGKAIGLSVSGYRTPDGQYYKIEIPFQSEDGKVTGKILSAKDSARYPGWGVVTLAENAVLSMKNAKGEEASLDPQAFKNFIVNKNHKIKEQLELRQEKAKAKEGKINSGVADGR